MEGRREEGEERGRGGGRGEEGGREEGRRRRRGEKGGREGGSKEKREMKKEAGMEEREWRTTYLVPNETVITQKIFIPATHLGGREDGRKGGWEGEGRKNHFSEYIHYKFYTIHNVGIVKG